MSSDMPCSLCGNYHGSAVCPLQIPPPSTAVPQPQTVGKVEFGEATLNGLSFGEQQISDKLDQIIKLLRQVYKELI